MSSQGILVPPSENKEHEALWNETWKRLERFLPHLFAEIFPEEAKKPRSAAPKRSSTESQPRAGTPSQSAPQSARASVEESGKGKEAASEKTAEA